MCPATPPSSLAEAFAAAQERARGLPKTPTNSELLDLYALYKQGTLGDARGKRPGLFDVRGRAKYDAWAARAGTPKEAAMQAYVELVAELVEKYGR